MQLVIDISEEDYKRGTVMASAIRNGIPLPKGHGDLIDRSMLPTDYIADDDIADALAIIRADKEN